MTSSQKSRGGTKAMGKKQGEKSLTPVASGKSIDLDKKGLRFRVSDDASREINRVEARASRSMATSARFAFR
jgi:hypothetical protein